MKTLCFQSVLMLLLFYPWHFVQACSCGYRDENNDEKLYRSKVAFVAKLISKEGIKATNLSPTGVKLQFEVEEILKGQASSKVTGRIFPDGMCGGGDQTTIGSRYIVFHYSVFKAPPTTLTETEFGLCNMPVLVESDEKLADLRLAAIPPLPCTEVEQNFIREKAIGSPPLGSILFTNCNFRPSGFLEANGTLSYTTARGNFFNATFQYLKLRKDRISGFMDPSSSNWTRIIPLLKDLETHKVFRKKVSAKGTFEIIFNDAGKPSFVTHKHGKKVESIFSLEPGGILIFADPERNQKLPQKNNRNQNISLIVDSLQSSAEFQTKIKRSINAMKSGAVIDGRAFYLKSAENLLR